MEKKVKRVIAVFMALVFIITAAMPGYGVSASSLFCTDDTEKTAEVADTQGFQAGAGNSTVPSLLPAIEETTVQYGTAGDTWAGYEPVLYNAQDRQDLEASEVATAEDIVVAVGYGFDVWNDFEGISFNSSMVKVSYYDVYGDFDSNTAGDYYTYYKAEPLSGKKPYLLCRVVSVIQPGDIPAGYCGTASSSAVSVTREPYSVYGEAAVTGQPADVYSTSAAKAVPGGAFSAGIPDDLSAGEIEALSEGGSIVMKMASQPLLRAASATAGKSLEVGCSGYVKYCGYSIGVKYVTSPGDYHNHLVYCMDLNRGTTNGTVSPSGSSRVKPQVTYCLVNGARKLGGKCYNDKYSAGSPEEDYFITSAAIHVLNGEVKASYYNDGSKVYKKIIQMVSDAKDYKDTEYSDSGLTKSISYSISPKKTGWKDIGDGLYRSVDKFERTKTGTITDVKYSISGAPAGLVTGEVKTDSSEISDTSDLKKYDICVAQTDAGKASSNFYLYCNENAYKKITEESSVIKVVAKAYSDEKGGRKWTPAVISQQKITFLEEYTGVKSDEASVRVTAPSYKEGKFWLKKTDSFSGVPVAGARYYLYEDEACEDLFCKLVKTDIHGLAHSGSEILTEDTYYLKEVFAPEGYVLDENVYKVGKEYFTITNPAGEIIQDGKEMEVTDEPEPVGVIVKKTDKSTGRTVTGAGFAVFDDAACTKRTVTDSKKKEEVPVFYYSEELGVAASEKFEQTQSDYYVKEVEVPGGYTDSGTVWKVQPEKGGFAELTITNTPVRCDVQAVKEDMETGTKAQGDAVLAGAVYGLYAAEDIVYPDGSGIVTYNGKNNITFSKGTGFTSTGNEAKAGTLLASVQTGNKGEFNFENLYCGNYYIQEISAGTGYCLDSTKYPVNFTGGKEKHKDISLNCTVKEKVKKQAFGIVKISDSGDGTETSYVAGAGFTVKLKSEVDKSGWDAAAVYDTFTTDGKGSAVSKELPYGKYIVRETKVPPGLYKAGDFTVDINEDSRTPQKWGFVNDAPFKAYIRLVKKDAVTGETILVDGASFRIKNTKTGSYVEQGREKTSVFATDSTGTVTTPLELKYGSYEVEEIKAPEGYLLSGKNIPFVVSKECAIKFEEGKDGKAVISVEIKNMPVKGSILIRKAGETLSSIENTTVKAAGSSINFSYKKIPLAGAKFQVSVAEEIYTPDHQKDKKGDRKLAVINGIPATKGAVVATVSTGADGKAGVNGLPLGKYKVTEIKAPYGFAVSESAADVELSYKDSKTGIVYGKAAFTNERVKTGLLVVKKDKVTGHPVKGAVYGVYTKDGITAASGGAVVTAGSLVCPAVTNASGSAVFEADLPLGRYYVKEIKAPEGYLADKTVYGVDFTYKGQKTAVIRKEVAIEETPLTVEVSKTDFTTGKSLAGAKLEITGSNGKVYASWVTDGKPYRLHAMPAGEYTLRETFAPYGYLIADEVKFTVKETGEIQKVYIPDKRVKGMVKIYKTDSHTKKAIKGVEFELRTKDGSVLEKLITDVDGIAKTGLLDICSYNSQGNFEKDIPYYVVETKAADGYILDSMAHKVILQYDDSATDTIVYTLELKNKPRPWLPQTGGHYRPWLFRLAGGILVAAGIAMYRKKRRRYRNL